VRWRWRWGSNLAPIVKSPPVSIHVVMLFYLCTTGGAASGTHRQRQQRQQQRLSSSRCGGARQKRCIFISCRSRSRSGGAQQRARGGGAGCTGPGAAVKGDGSLQIERPQGVLWFELAGWLAGCVTGCVMQDLFAGFAELASSQLLLSFCPSLKKN